MAGDAGADNIKSAQCGLAASIRHEALRRGADQDDGLDSFVLQDLFQICLVNLSTPDVTDGSSAAGATSGMISAAVVLGIVL